MAHSYSHLFRLPTTGLRFFTVYGPWGRPDMAPMLFTQGDPRRRADPRVQPRPDAPRLHLRRRHRRRRRARARPPARGAAPAAARRTRSTTSATTRRSSSTTFIATLERAARAHGDPRLPADAAGRRAGDLRVDRPAARADRIRAAHAARRRPRALRRLVSRATTALSAPTARRGATGKIARSRAHPRTRVARPLANLRMILVTGGAGFIGANFVLDWLAATGEPVVNLDKLTYAGNLGNLASLARRRAARVRARRHRRPRAGRARCSREHRPRAIVNFAAETHVDRSIHGPAAFVADQRRRHVRPARGDARVVGGAARGRARRVPLPARLDRRGLRLARRRRSGVHRDDAVRAQQPVLGVQGRVRPPRARLSPHLRPADAHDELLEQLRPVSVSREADPADDRQRARGQAAAGLRRRPATCATGSTSTITARRFARCSTRGRPGETYNIGGNAEMQNLDVVRDALRAAGARRGRAATTRR